MNRLIGSEKIAKQLQNIQQELDIDVTKEPILLQISEGVYVIGYSLDKDVPDLQFTLSTSPMHIISKTRFLDNPLDTTKFGDSSPVLQFDDGYLVLTMEGYRFTPYKYELNSCIPHSPISGRQSVEVTMLLEEASITMTTAKYASIELAKSEWDELGDDSMIRIVSELLQNGKIKETYTTNENEHKSSENAIVFIDGKEHSIKLDNHAIELMNHFMDNSTNRM